MAGAGAAGSGADARRAGNSVGGARLLRRGAGVLAGYAGAGAGAYGIDAAGLARWAGELAGRVEAGERIDAAAEAPGCSRSQELGGGGLEEVPAVAVEVLEDGDGAVRLVPGLLQEADALGGHPGVVGGEVGGVEEEADAAAGLVADAGALGLVLGAGQQQGGLLGAGRADDDPTGAVRPGVSSASSKPSARV